MIPSEFVGIVLVELDKKACTNEYDVTQTANVMVTESVGQQELSGVEDQRVELDSLNQSGNAHSAAGSDSGSSET